MKHALLALALLCALAAMPARAQEQNRAAVAVFFGDGSSAARCVAFSEASISGYELLRRSGLPLAVEFGSVGAAVCRIEQVGCAYPDQPCFCQCQTLGASCTYWVYMQLADGAWRTSGQGAGMQQVRDGDVDGWLWSTGSDRSGQSTGALPDPVPFEQVCGTASATATPGPAATPTATQAQADATMSDSADASALWFTLAGAAVALVAIVLAMRRRGAQ